MQTSEQQILISEDKIITPLTDVLNSVNTSIPQGTKYSSSSISESLDILFPEQQYDDKSIQKAKEILGEQHCSILKSNLRKLLQKSSI